MKYAKKLPPYGAALAARLNFNNHPFLIHVCIGQDSWNKAKRINLIGQSSALILPAGEKPSAYSWHLLRGQTVIIDWSQGPSREFVAELAMAIARCEPQVLVVYPNFVDYKASAFIYDATKPIGNRWTQCRDSIQVFHSRLAVAG